MRQTLTITEEHLSRALAVPWETNNCLVAQCIQDAVGPLETCGWSSCHTMAGKTYNVFGAGDIQLEFDKLHGPNAGADAPTEQEVRAMLPHEIEIELAA